MFHSFISSLNHRSKSPGTFDFGIIDPSKYTDAITYVHVNASRGLWEFTGSGYAVGNHPFESSSIDAMYVFVFEKIPAAHLYAF